jgi:hypothetical protein
MRTYHDKKEDERSGLAILGPQASAPRVDLEKAHVLSQPRERACMYNREVE